MKKQIKILIILILVFILIVAGNIIIRHCSDNKKDTLAETTVIIKVNDYTDLSEIAFNNGTTNLVFQKQNDVWSSPNDESLELKDTTMTSLQNDYMGLIASRELKDGDSLESYGLTNPTYEVTIKNSDGNTQNIKIGGKYNDEYYVMVNDDADTIYLCTFNFISYLSYDIEKFAVTEEETTES